jgi:hypothetical protein
VSVLILPTAGTEIIIANDAPGEIYVTRIGCGTVTQAGIDDGNGDARAVPT